MAVRVLIAPLRQTSRSTAGAPYETHCVICGGPAYALGGGSLFCLRCLQPFVVAGEAFQASISVRRATG